MAIYLAILLSLKLMARVKQLLEAMDHQGWAVFPDFMGQPESRRLRDECELSSTRGEFKRAGIGRGMATEIREDIRSDQIMWLETSEAASEQHAYLAKLEELRLAFNERFFLGLFDFEGHFAFYPQGGFYKPHLDRHAGSSERILTTILYLNEDWQTGDGGELKLWKTCGEKTGPFEIIEPRLGTLVCFHSGDHWHEVLPAIKPRRSITGWFRQRP